MLNRTPLKRGNKPLKRTALRKGGPKKRSPTFYRKKCVTHAKLEARKRDGDKCQYCGRLRAEGWQMHASHILPEGAYPLMSAEPENMITLCAEHHVAGMSMFMGNSREPSWHGDPMFFAKWFERKWPGRYDKLREMAKEKESHIVDWERKWKETEKHE